MTKCFYAECPSDHTVNFPAVPISTVEKLRAQNAKREQALKSKKEKKKGKEPVKANEENSCYVEVINWGKSGGRVIGNKRKWTLEVERRAFTCNFANVDDDFILNNNADFFYYDMNDQNGKKDKGDEIEQVKYPSLMNYLSRFSGGVSNVVECIRDHNNHDSATFPFERFLELLVIQKAQCKTVMVRKMNDESFEMYCFQIVPDAIQKLTSYYALIQPLTVVSTMVKDGTLLHIGQAFLFICLNVICGIDWEKMQHEKLYESFESNVGYVFDVLIEKVIGEKTIQTEEMVYEFVDEFRIALVADHLRKQPLLENVKKDDCLYESFAYDAKISFEEHKQHSARLGLTNFIETASNVIPVWQARISVIAGYFANFLKFSPMYEVIVLKLVRSALYYKMPLEERNKHAGMLDRIFYDWLECIGHGGRSRESLKSSLAFPYLGSILKEEKYRRPAKDNAPGASGLAGPCSSEQQQDESAAEAVDNSKAGTSDQSLKLEIVVDGSKDKETEESEIQLCLRLMNQLDNARKDKAEKDEKKPLESEYTKMFNEIRGTNERFEKLNSSLRAKDEELNRLNSQNFREMKKRKDLETKVHNLEKLKKEGKETYKKQRLSLEEKYRALELQSQKLVLFYNYSNFKFNFCRDKADFDKKLKAKEAELLSESKAAKAAKQQAKQLQEQLNSSKILETKMRQMEKIRKEEKEEFEKRRVSMEEKYSKLELQSQKFVSFHYSFDFKFNFCREKTDFEGRFKAMENAYLLGAKATEQAKKHAAETRDQLTFLATDIQQQLETKMNRIISVEVELQQLKTEKDQILKGREMIVVESREMIKQLDLYKNRCAALEKQNENEVQKRQNIEHEKKSLEVKLQDQQKLYNLCLSSMDQRGGLFADPSPSTASHPQNLEISSNDTQQVLRQSVEANELYCLKQFYALPDYYSLYKDHSAFTESSQTRDINATNDPQITSVYSSQHYDNTPPGTTNNSSPFSAEFPNESGTSHPEHNVYAPNYF
ncbi:Protein CBG14851 [Caenorhabditis briggsae]|uniref:Protein CBG14851 n=1 Tax=Caenorhabditis briggsae TaxID=6238 RepID=A8XKU5_CAEBR|nr:Protein CBG14851 [Caenorhabditis briggsae]CAP33269.2 Protein CBG14851 [Caenorhabditis briggsae]